MSNWIPETQANFGCGKSSEFGTTAKSKRIVVDELQRVLTGATDPEYKASLSRMLERANKALEAHTDPTGIYIDSLTISKKST